MKSDRSDGDAGQLAMAFAVALAVAFAVGFEAAFAVVCRDTLASNRIAVYIKF